MTVFLKCSLYLLANASHFVFADLLVAMDTQHALVIVGNRRCRVANACLSYLRVADYGPGPLSNENPFAVNRSDHWRKSLPAHQGDPVDQQCGGTGPRATQQAGEAFQIYRYVLRPHCY